MTIRRGFPALLSRIMMARLQSVIARIAESGAADVADGDQALHLVMSRAVQDIGEADGESGRGSLNPDKKRFIIHYPVSEQNFLTPTVAHVAGGGVIQDAEHRDPAEQPGIPMVPEGMGLDYRLSGNGRDRNRGRR